MLDFSHIKAITIPEGEVKKITNSQGITLWEKPQADDVYTPLSYLEFNADMVFDTGVICNQETTLEIRFTRESSESRYFYGVRTSDNKATVAAYLATSGAWRFGGAYKNLTMSNATTVRNMTVSKTNIVYGSSTYKYTGTVGTFTTPYTLTIGSARGTDGTYYYFRKLFKESVVSNSTNLIYGGDVYIRVNKSTGAYEQIGEQKTWYSKDQADAKLDLKADKSATYTKTEIDNIIATLEASAYQVVESLPEQGQNGVVYLIETSEGVYEQYVWASGAYIDLGSTQIDLSAYQPLIDSSHKLSADLVDDTNTNHKFVSSSEKSTWNAKQNDVCLSVVDGKLCISYEEA